MKKTLTVLAAVLALVMVFSVVAGAKGVLAPVADGVTVAKAVAADTPVTDIFSVSGDPFTVTDINGEYFLKATGATNPRMIIGTEYADVTGYGYIRLRLQNAVGFDGMMVGGTADENSVIFDNFLFVDMDGNVVSNVNGYVCAYPADFDGYMYISLTHWTWQGGGNGTRTADDTTVLEKEGAEWKFDPASLWRINCNWLACTGDFAVGEVALVKDVENQSVVTNPAPANLNFVITDDFDSWTDLPAGSSLPYASDGIDASGEVITESNGNVAFRFGLDQSAASHAIGKIVTTVAAPETAYAFGFYIKNTGVNAVDIWQFMIPEGGTAYTAFELYDMDGNLVENEAENGVRIPEGFEGYVALLDVDFSNASSFVFWQWGDNEDSELVWDNFGYFAAEPTAPVNPTEPPVDPVDPTDPDDPGNYGAVSMIGFAVAAIASAAVVVRKKH